MAENKDNIFFQRLTQLFRSGPSIQRKIKGQNYKNYYDNSLIHNNLGYRGVSPFGKESSPFSVLGGYGILDRMTRYSEFSEMEQCLHPDTLIAVPGGFKTIKELSDEYGIEKEFTVYSYDHNKKSIVAATAKQARKTREEHMYKVVFDNGEHIIGTADHKLLKRSGIYCRIKDLKSDDAMMPFYTKKYYRDQNKKEKYYNSIYSMDSRYNSGWQPEHRILAEYVLDRNLNDDEVVHHINFISNDNSLENLTVMSKKDHDNYHINILNGKKWSKENLEWILKFKKEHSEFMKINNPAERFDITFGKILQWCEENEFNLTKLCTFFNTDENVIYRKLKSKGYDNFTVFAKSYIPNWKNNGQNNNGAQNPKYNHSLTFENICNVYKPGMTKQQLASKFNVSVIPIQYRLKSNGFKTWNSFVENYQNMKVVSVEYYGFGPVYDLTVDKYKNFATNTVISHNTPEISTALNVFADETCATDEKGRCFHIFSENPQIKKALEELFYDVLNVEFNLRSWTRNLCKYGDFFTYNEVSPEHGIINVSPIPVDQMEREEGWDQNDPYAIRFKWLTRGNKILENWQVSHMRILGNDMFLPYGMSMLDSSRRIWRQLTMMEDAMLTYRVVRSPERRVFYIDVGNIAPNDIPTYMEAAKSALRSNSQIDRMNGRQDYRYNPVAIDEDYFIPVRGESRGTKIETLAGGQHVSATEDVEYLHKKLLSALQIPGAYLGYDENIGSKALLASEDIKFSRTINSIQKIVIAELNKLAMIHLYTKGFDAEDLVNFELFLSNPSAIALQQKLALWSDRFDIINKAKESEIVDHEWMRKTILGLTNEECDEIKVRMKEDKLYMAELDVIAVKNQPPGKTTTDVFDNTNYNVPGSTIEKEVTTNSQDMSDEELVRNISKFDGDGNIIISHDPPGKAPIAAKPYATQRRRNEKRQVGMGGRDNLNMPDFGRMVNYNQSKSLYDASGIDDVKNPFRESAQDKEMKRVIGSIPTFSKEMKDIFKKLDEMNPKKSKKLLSENSENIDKKLKEEFEKFEIDIEF